MLLDTRARSRVLEFRIRRLLFITVPIKIIITEKSINFKFFIYIYIYAKYWFPIDLQKGGLFFFFFFCRALCIILILFVMQWNVNINFENSVPDRCVYSCWCSVNIFFCVVRLKLICKMTRFLAPILFGQPISNFSQILFLLIIMVIV